jgi:chorismate mutase
MQAGRPRYKRAKRRALLSLLVALLAGCATPPPAADLEKIDRVLVLIQQRLDYMDDVARNKWNSGAPIEDLPREREIIDAIGAQAGIYSLDPAVAKDFFHAQIEASKIIQYTRFREWRARNQPPFDSIPGLRNQIRPALDALTPALLAALAAAMPELARPGGAAVVEARAKSIVTGASAGAPARNAAVTPLTSIAGNR